MILSISIKKQVADEAEAKKVAEQLEKIFGSDAKASISAVVVTEIVKLKPITAQPK